MPNLSIESFSSPLWGTEVDRAPAKRQTAQLLYVIAFGVLLPIHGIFMRSELTKDLQSFSSTLLPNGPSPDISRFLRTSIYDRIEILSGGCELIPITILPRLLPISYQTIKNQICAERFPLEIIFFNAKNHVRVEDLVRFIYKKGLSSFSKKTGRKTNEERAQLNHEQGGQS